MSPLCGCQATRRSVYNAYKSAVTYVLIALISTVFLEYIHQVCKQSALHKPLSFTFAL